MGSFFLLLYTFFSFSDVWLNGNLAMMQTKEDRGPSDVRYRTELFNAYSAAWTFSQGFQAGASFYNFRDNRLNQTTWGVGPRAGLFIYGLELCASLYLVARDKSEGGERTGRGLGITVGYTAELTPQLRAGFHVNYLLMSYGFQNGAALSPNHQISYLIPAIAIGLLL